MYVECGGTFGVPLHWLELFRESVSQSVPTRPEWYQVNIFHRRLYRTVRGSCCFFSAENVVQESNPVDALKLKTATAGSTIHCHMSRGAHIQGDSLQGSSSRGVTVRHRIVLGLLPAAVVVLLLLR